MTFQNLNLTSSYLNMFPFFKNIYIYIYIYSYNFHTKYKNYCIKSMKFVIYVLKSYFKKILKLEAVKTILLDKLFLLL